MINYKRLDKSFAAEIAEIEKQSFSKPQTKCNIKAHFDNENNLFFGAFDGDILCGYGSFAFIANECYIDNIAVAEKYRRRKIGSGILTEIEKFCKEKNAEFATLEVRESNIAAVCLYKKHYFVQTAIRKNYYTAPIENALIMTKSDFVRI